MRDLIEFIARELVEHPDDVEVFEEDDGSELELIVAPSDLGKVIGRRGRTAKAMRTLLQTAAGRQRVELEISDGSEDDGEDDDDFDDEDSDAELGSE